MIKDILNRITHVNIRKWDCLSIMKIDKRTRFHKKIYAKIYMKFEKN